MKPIGPLMREHRLIERMIALMVEEEKRIGAGEKADYLFVYNTIDFFRTYVDETHHEKEEKIQFKTLAEKNMKPEMQRIMQELIDEHTAARGIIDELQRGLEGYEEEKPDTAKGISNSLQRMIDLYPKHIEKEDKRFFFPSLEYLTQDEQDKMLQAFHDFDQNIVHLKYTKLVEELKSVLV